MAKEQHKILVISDNPTLAERLEKEVWPLVETANRYNLEFKCSPNSNILQFKNNNPVTTIDLKNDRDVDSIKNSYLIISMHCKQLFPVELIKAVRCINVHPGYNPYNRGWYPQVFAIINDNIVGATIHEIDEKLDHGPIICREEVEKHASDTSLTLYEKITSKEIDLLKININKIITNNYSTILPEIEGELYLKKDFNELCYLNLDETLTLGHAIDKIRALTHGHFKNAYFKDELGRKIYVSINLTLHEDA